MRTFLVKRVVKARMPAKMRPTSVPPMLTMRNEAWGRDREKQTKDRTQQERNIKKSQMRNEKGTAWNSIMWGSFTVLHESKCMEIDPNDMRPPFISLYSLLTQSCNNAEVTGSTKNGGLGNDMVMWGMVCVIECHCFGYDFRILRINMKYSPTPLK